MPSELVIAFVGMSTGIASIRVIFIARPPAVDGCVKRRITLAVTVETLSSTRIDWPQVIEPTEKTAPSVGVS